MAKQVVAMAIGDTHWSEKPPIFRSVEEDWLKTQCTYMLQLKCLYEKLGRPPILIAGDLFDKWNSSAHLINHVISWLDQMDCYTIPGNHDIPNHNYLEIRRSAYWTLVESKAIRHLVPGPPTSVGNLIVHAFPHNVSVTPPGKTSADDLCVKVALIHDYIWTEKTSFEGADPKLRYAQWAKKLDGYDVAVFGDNHNPFTIKKEGKCTVMNMGTFMCRHYNEKEINPSVGIIYSDGSVGRHYLDVSRDKFLDVGEKVSGLENNLRLDLSEFTEELNALHSEKLDYGRLVMRWMQKEKIEQRIQNVMMRALGAKLE